MLQSNILRAHIRRHENPAAGTQVGGAVHTTLKRPREPVENSADDSGTLSVDSLYSSAADSPDFLASPYDDGLPYVDVASLRKVMTGEFAKV